MKIILKKLYLQNFATFSNQDIEFDHGLNIIMGETGSGKSLILDALLLILGGKSDKKFIRAQTNSATVEAIFQIDAGPSGQFVKKYFDEIGHPCEEDEISIKRIIFLNEKAKIYLNQQICGLSVLQNFAKDFVDVVGQFENQKLLLPEYQLQIVDYFITDKSPIVEYQNNFLRYQQLESEFSQLKKRQEVKLERETYLKFLVEEFNKANPSELEEERCLRLKLERSQWEEKNIFINALSSLVNDDVGASGHSLQDQLRQLKNLLSKGKKFYSSNVVDSCVDAIFQLESQLESITSKRAEEVDEEAFQQALDRLDQFQKLKKKFGVSMKELSLKAQEYRDELESLNDLDSQMEKIQVEISKTEKILWSLAKKLRDLRLAVCAKLSEKLSDTVQQLNMSGAQIRFNLEEKKELTANGIDQVKLMARLNLGEGEHELIHIASGGELSRILLALRQITALNQSVSIFLFDEIDTGIGGKTALLIGKSLRQ
nr:AAA family ATPase [Bacteriovoracaceae bacterium]